MQISSKHFLKDDVSAFFNLISDCIGIKLSESKNMLDINHPIWDSHNSSKSILCKIDDKHYVCLKRYDDSFHFAKHEVVMSKIKRQVGFPYYNVIESKGLTLRLADTHENPSLLAGWEKSLFLAIDFGQYMQSKNLRDLPIDLVKNSASFYRFYGKWAAFNYLFGIQDRNSSNFIYFLDTGIMHSADNEPGPFDWMNRSVGVLDIIYRTRKGFVRYMKTPNLDAKEYLITGFIDGWNQIKNSSSKITDLDENEMKLLEKKLIDLPEQIARIFFVYAKWNKI